MSQCALRTGRRPGPPCPGTGGRTVPAPTTPSASPRAPPDASEDRDSAPADDLLAAAKKALPDGREKVPPLRTIQSTLRCGQPASQRVQAHFKTPICLMGSMNRIPVRDD